MFYFSKMQATGNDFIVIDYIENRFEYSFKRLSKFLCDRHYGIGGDGVIIIDKSLHADVKMRIFNSDGSEAEMCGNGMRCLAKFVYENKLINKTEFQIETLGGIKSVKLNMEGKKILSVKVNMGTPIFDYEKIPVIYNEEEKFKISNNEKNGTNNIEKKNTLCVENLNNNESDIVFFKECAKSKKISIDNMDFFAVSLGNPHVVTFGKDIENIDIKNIGRKIENYKYFPNKINVEFVEILENNKIKVRIWERGVGETLSCGTGICAAAIISRMQKNTNTELMVNTKGGILNTFYDEKEKNIYLEGEVEEVFKGNLNI